MADSWQEAREMVDEDALRSCAEVEVVLAEEGAARQRGRLVRPHRYLSDGLSR